MSEDEAKGKMCCGPPLLAAAALAVHPDATVDPRTAGKCIGSACMAWRWAKLPNGRTEFRPGKEVRIEVPGDGFCGLAGSPQ